MKKSQVYLIFFNNWVASGIDFQSKNHLHFNIWGTSLFIRINYFLKYILQKSNMNRFVCILTTFYHFLVLQPKLYLWFNIFWTLLEWIPSLKVSACFCPLSLMNWSQMFFQVIFLRAAVIKRISLKKVFPSWIEAICLCKWSFLQWSW